MGEGMAGKGGFIGYSSGYRYRTRRAPRHGTIGYNVDSYYDVYVDDYFDEDVEPAPEIEGPVDPNLFAQNLLHHVPAVVDPATTFKEDDFKHLEWDKGVVAFEDTYKPPEPPAEEAVVVKEEPVVEKAPVKEAVIPNGEGVYVTVGADGSLIGADGGVLEVLANGVLRNAGGAIFATTGVILSTENALVNGAVVFEGSIALADGVKLEEGRKFVIKEQSLKEGESLLSWLGGADFVDGTGQLFRRLADGSFVGAGGDHLAAFVHAGMSLAAGT